jgi:hypothetical protein
LRRDLHDGRFATLIDGLLKAGYMEDWMLYETESGTPQGGIISPLLSNIYLNELDRFVEDTLIPEYTRGKRRRENPEYKRVQSRKRTATRRNDTEEVKRWLQEMRRTQSQGPMDPDHRRLRYVRYADDFLLSFAGPKDEAEQIRRRIADFLEKDLKLTLSMEKTIITHAVDDTATFLGYEIKVSRRNDLISLDGRRGANWMIALIMPRKVVLKYRDLYSKNGKITHKPELLNDSVYTIIQRYQGVLRGLYNYYCMAVNVSKRMDRIRFILITSLLKTLANKHKSSVTKMVKKYQVVESGMKMLRVVVQRPEKKPLIGIFGGFPFKRKPDGYGGKTTDFVFVKSWNSPGGKRSEVVQRLMYGKCEICGAEEPSVRTEVHHVRKLSDIDRPGRRPRTNAERIMAARKRKTLVVCDGCHDDIHAGRYDGPAL